MIKQQIKSIRFHRVKEVEPDLYKTVVSIFNELVEIRRDFRKNPELAFQEHRTSSIVADYLKNFGYEVQEGVGNTGVIGILKGKEEGNVIGLRADMDALPMPDEIDEPYKSINEGIAHTCGHDMHTANMIGVAKIFSIIGLEKGTLKLIFQPAEEIGAGAKAMVDDSALENPRVDMMAGLHVHPSISVGKFGISSAEFSGAAVDVFELNVTGKGGHAAYPHLAIDPVMITAQILVALQQIVSRQVDPLDSVVLSVGQINGGTKDTILPDTVTAKGTVRTLKPKTREFVSKQMKQIASSVAAGFGATCNLTYHHVTPSVKIDDSSKQLLIESISELFGSENIKYSSIPSMGGEDFAYFSQEVPSIFFRLGTKSGESTSYANHNTKFNVDEEALLYGVTTLTHLTCKFLQKDKM